MGYYEKGYLLKQMELGGQSLALETGRLAKQANGAVKVQYGETVVLVTATMSAKPREGADFFPLTVDYEEKLYAAGKIPGGFIKREGKPSEKAILSARLIDRPIRPLFPKGFRHDVQVIATVLSVDQDNRPEIAAMIGASAALTISDIPFAGPIAGVNVGLIDGEMVINPKLGLDEQNKMNLTVAGSKDAVMMVEAGAQEIDEETILQAISLGHETIKGITDFITAFRDEALELGFAKEKLIADIAVIDEELKNSIKCVVLPRLEEMIQQCIDQKMLKKPRELLFAQVQKELLEQLAEDYPEQEPAIIEIIGAAEKEIMRRHVLDNGVRIDSRRLDEVRTVTAEVGILPRVHGSGLFTRGQTQVLNVATLGAASDEQVLDGLGLEESKRYMHHYNFPPYSVGETKPVRGPGRREIGHGALAERALEPVIPAEDDFPYTIRLVSEVVESNGSSSMASVCASTLSLMDAGVPIKAPVSGVAMGLIKEGERYAVLTDIQGMEDALGDMDFKVAGTKDGITALQMDIKVAGVTVDILRQALQQAYQGRMFILDKMLATISEPRAELSPYAPRIFIIRIDPDKIRDVIGSGGKIIKKIIEETGAEIDIEDDGKVTIASVDPEKGKQAVAIIENITNDVEAGQIMTGKVTRVTDFGAFVEVVPGMLGLPGKEGLVHISQLAQFRVDKVEDVVKEGETVVVKVIGYDNQGRLKLSRKDAMPKDANDPAGAPGRSNGGNRNGGGRNGGGNRNQDRRNNN